MTPRDLHNLGISSLRDFDKLLIYVFFYGASFSLVVYGLSTSSITGVFVVLFFASVVIFMLVSPSSSESLIS